MKKTTVHGVKSESTKLMFKDLKKRGFEVSFEKGSNNTFKILAFINGCEFVLSCVDGKSPVYTKGYARNKRDWIVFLTADDLLVSSMVKKNSSATEKQKAYFNLLVSRVSEMTKNKVKIKIPENVVQMADAIKELIRIKECISSNQEIPKANFISIKLAKS